MSKCPYCQEEVFDQDGYEVKLITQLQAEEIRKERKEKRERPERARMELREFRNSPSYRWQEPVSAMAIFAMFLVALHCQLLGNINVERNLLVLVLGTPLGILWVVTRARYHFFVSHPEYKDLKGYGM